MDLRHYYQKIREIETNIHADHVLTISNQTQDGGRAGVATEVTRSNAAKLIVDGRARLATAEESDEYREKQLEARRRAEQALASKNLQVTVISDAELRLLRDRVRQQKG